MMNLSVTDELILPGFPQKTKIMNTEKRLGFVGIILEDRGQSAPLVNKLLSNHADISLARTGIPHIKGNNSVITLVVDSTTDELGKLTGLLGSIPGVQVKSALSKK
jgi:putative iron-only hydrogenase system regulator